MQKRKRVLSREERHIIHFLILIITVNISSAAIAGIPVWIKARNGAEHPDIVPNLSLTKPDENYLGLISSVSNPYSIDGITDSFIKTGICTGSDNLWVSWSLLHYDLYSENHVKISLSRKIAGRCLSIGIEPGVKGRRVKGFDYETNVTVNALIGFSWKGLFLYGFEEILYDSGHSNGHEAKFKLSIIDYPLSLLVNYQVFRRTDNDFLLGAEANLSSDLSLLSGYGFNNNEISSGLVYQRNNRYFGFSWNHHPVLGSTLSAGIGMLWAR